MTTENNEKIELHFDKYYVECDGCGKVCDESDLMLEEEVSAGNFWRGCDDCSEKFIALGVMRRIQGI
jgi:monomeric isocitrate dehydrogenase